MSGAGPVPPGSIHPLAGLMRGFVVDWLACADPEACARIMADGYTATVGGVRLAGRESDYLPATMGQLQRFPGLLVTVHDLWLTDRRAALRFTEHGAAPDRGPAAWAGIGIFDWDGARLTANVTEEDYLSRRRQFATRTPDQVARPATAPWSARPEPPDPGAEAAVRSWLAAGDLSGGGGVEIDDGWTGQPTPHLLDQHDVEVDTLMCAGRRVAFHLTQHGTYTGGMGLDDDPVGTPAVLRACGMVTVGAAGAVTGHVVRDRVGLRRDLVAVTA